MINASEAVTNALSAHIQSQEVSARNVANISTPGFKRNMALVDAATPGAVSVRLDLSQGSLQPTHNDLDIAIQGEGFFAVSTPRGTLYTRNGAFRLNENRVVTNQEGHAVLGEGGREIQLPEGNGDVTVSDRGEVRVGSEVVGRFQITAFDRPEMLRQAGASTFRGEGAAPREARGYSVRQGHIEGSNVSPVGELVRMMSTMREYEACARSLKSIEDSASRLYAWARG